MREAGLVIAACIGAILLGGCEDVRKALGQSKSAPDEFAVYSRAPLSLPPDYGLRPPAPGAGRPQGIEPRADALRAVLGTAGSRRPAPAPVTGDPGVQALLRELGALDVDPSIRATLNRETSILAEEDKSFTDLIMFWDSPTEYGTVVDAAAESKRIRENQALGRPITAGETPTIERKRKALLEGIFD